MKARKNVEAKRIHNSVKEWVKFDNPVRLQGKVHRYTGHDKIAAGD